MVRLVQNYLMANSWATNCSLFVSYDRRPIINRQIVHYQQTATRIQKYIKRTAGSQLPGIIFLTSCWSVGKVFVKCLVKCQVPVGYLFCTNFSMQWMREELLREGFFNRNVKFGPIWSWLDFLLIWGLFTSNFREDMYAQDSIDLLNRAGIQFKRHEDEGIDVSDFAELLITSGLVLNEDVKWLSFHR